MKENAKNTTTKNITIRKNNAKTTRTISRNNSIRIRRGRKRRTITKHDNNKDGQQYTYAG